MAERILVVEDDQCFREIVAKALTFSGYEVVTASNGLLALSACAECCPTLILLDLMMPEMSGETFLEESQRRGLDDIPVIVTTAKYLATGEEARLIKLNVASILRKPFHLEELLAAIAAVFNPTINKYLPNYRCAI